MADLKNSDEEFDREAWDHGVDEYVSDCNRLPFTDCAAKPASPVTVKAQVFTCLILLGLCGAGACGLAGLLNG